LKLIVGVILRSSGVDLEAIRDYFPANVVVDGMLEIYERLLGFRFHRVPQNVANIWYLLLAKMDVS